MPKFDPELAVHTNLEEYIVLRHADAIADHVGYHVHPMGIDFEALEEGDKRYPAQHLEEPEEVVLIATASFDGCSHRLQGYEVEFIVSDFTIKGIVDDDDACLKEFCDRFRTAYRASATLGTIDSQLLLERDLEEMDDPADPRSGENFHHEMMQHFTHDAEGLHEWRPKSADVSSAHDAFTNLGVQFERAPIYQEKPGLRGKCRGEIRLYWNEVEDLWESAEVRRSIYRKLEEALRNELAKGAIDWEHLDDDEDDVLSDDSFFLDDEGNLRLSDEDPGLAERLRIQRRG